MIMKRPVEGFGPTALWLLILVCSPRLSADPPCDDDLRQAIQELAHERFVVRQRALKRLEAASERAEHLLRAATRSDDPEVERQARTLLQRLVLRIDRTTPPDIAHRLLLFHQSADKPAVQAQILRELLDLGDAAHGHVMRLLDTSTVDQRRLILEEFSHDDWRILSALVARGRDEIAFDLVGEALAAQLSSITPHFAYLVAQRQQLETRLADYRKRLDRGGLTFDARVLVTLASFQGDAEQALSAARRADDLQLLRSWLIETGRWSELADSVLVPSLTPQVIADWGVRLGALRHSGRQEEVRQEIAMVENLTTDTRGRGRPSRTTGNIVKILLLNEQTESALTLLSRTNESRRLVELKLALGQIDEALQLSEAAAEAERGVHIAAGIAHMDLLIRLGLRERARKWIERLHAQKGEIPEIWREPVTIALIRLGMRDEGKQAVRKAIESRDPGVERLLSTLEPRLGPDAEVCYRLVVQGLPDGSIDQHLEQLHEIAEGRWQVAELERLVRQQVPVTEVNGARQYTAVARRVARWGLVSAARDLATDPAWADAPPEALVWLADTLADSNHWAEAAAVYQRAWQRERTAPLPLFLMAHATSQAAPQHPEVRTWIQRSHRLPVGNISVRQGFYAALSSRGFTHDALEELDICYKLRDRGTTSVIELNDELARVWTRMGRPAAAASVLRHNIFRVLFPSRGYVRNEAYLHLPAMVRLLQALALYQEGDDRGAAKEVEIAESLSPMFMEIPLHLAPVLRQRGDPRAADRLLERFEERWRRIVEQFPDDAEAHFQLARLALLGKGRADQALKSARRAVDLNPLDPVYQEILAEVLFQTGHRPEALVTIQNCRRLPHADWHRCRRILNCYERGESAGPILAE